MSLAYIYKSIEYIPSRLEARGQILSRERQADWPDWRRPGGGPCVEVDTASKMP